MQIILLRQYIKDCIILNNHKYKLKQRLYLLGDLKMELIQLKLRRSSCQLLIRSPRRSREKERLKNT